jgi:hypothetical protein
MVGLPNPISNLLHPNRASASRTPRNQKPKAKPEADAEGDDEYDEDDANDAAPAVSSKTSSSCEIFSLFKMMAAGKGNQKSLSEEVDSDESEGDEPESQPGTSVDPVPTSQASRPAEEGVRHSEDSSATTRVGEALYDDDDEDEGDDTTAMVGDREAKSALMSDWHRDQAQNTADMEAHGQRLAGKANVNIPPTIHMANV